MRALGMEKREERITNRLATNEQLRASVRHSHFAVNSSSSARLSPPAGSSASPLRSGGDQEPEPQENETDTEPSPAQLYEKFKTASGEQVDIAPDMASDQLGEHSTMFGIGSSSKL
jgi:hypothetical protein